MQNGRSSAKGSAAAPKPTKFRLACDTCQRSKIRCDQERPSCRRCVKKGIDCVYSPARRAGRPRTRNNHANSSVQTPGAVRSPTQNMTPPAMQQNISIPTTQWIPPTPPPSTSVSSAEDSAGPTSLIPHLTQPLQLLSPSDLSVSHEQQSDDYFLQGLMDLTATTPSQACQLDPGVFDICPELLDPSLCGPPWEEPEQQHAFSTTTAADDINNSAPTAPPTQQEEASASPAPEPADPPKQCHCVAALLDHLSTSSSSPPSSSSSSPAPSLSEAALRTSKALLARCRTILRCANRCASRSSTALVVCEAVDQALGGLGAQPSSKGWRRQQEEEGERPGDEQEVLRCGGVAIRGAERRAAVRALLVKRLLELRGVLEALLQAVRGTAAAGRRAGVERACWRVCAELVAEFAGRVAERVEFVKVHL